MNIQYELKCLYKSQTQRESGRKVSLITIMEGVVVLSLVKHLTRSAVQTRGGVGVGEDHREEHGGCYSLYSSSK